ncbi:DUF3040 domain-containing protein [Arthrobacter crystallopoietes]|uniref:DUF3040 domain-containing protein n=1 Tax=Crystallibacter crystallopoietes TaxID=37928 RepID=UPI003D1F8FE1
MALSEEERKRLEELERDLTKDDPALARELAPGPSDDSAGRLAVLCILAAVAGLVLLIIGIATQTIVVGVLGFLLMSGSVYRLMTAPPPRDER